MKNTVNKKKKPKKILLTHRYFWPDKSSCSSIIKDITFHLSSIGYNLEVISSQPSYLKNTKVKKNFEIQYINNIKVNRLSLKNETGTLVRRVINSIKIGFFLLYKSIFNKYDLLIVTSIPPILGGFFGILASKLSNTKLIYFCMDIHPEIGILSNDYSNNIFFKILQKIDSFNCHNSDIVLVHSEDMKNTLKNRIGFKKSNILIMNNFAKASKKFSKNNHSFSKKNENNFKIIYTGNIGRFQCLDEIVNSMVQLKNNKKIELVIIGEGVLKEKLKKLIYKNNVNIKLLNYMPENEIFDQISKSDIGLVPLMKNMYKYAYPSKTMSYLSQGKPIIAIVEKNSELVKNMKKYNYGKYLSQNNLDYFPNLLVDLSTNHSSVIEMGNNAFIAFEKEFSDKVVLEKWANVVSRAIGGNI